MEPWDQSVHPYRGRKAVLSTKHGKERSIAPPLTAGVGLEILVPDGLDTDMLGTFTGEVPRIGPALEVALRKARLGMARAGLPLGLANEGSFGPHPELVFVPGDHEILVFVDDEMGIEVVEETLSAATNFAHQETAAAEDLDDFLKQARFPSHGLIVRPNSGLQPGLLFKGITTPPLLADAVQRCAKASEDGLAHVETDMRAQMNPMRQAVLRDLADRLAQRLAARCPQCGAPGWGVVDVVRGLPCELCGQETEGVREEVYGCPRCELRHSRPRKDGRRQADARDCPFCNP